MQTWEQEKAKLLRQYDTAKDKLSLVRESKDKEIKDLNRKITDISSKLKTQVQKTSEFERKLNQERDSYNQKVRSVNNSVDYKQSTENSIKSKQKNSKYLASINSGSKTTTTEKMNKNFQSVHQQSNSIPVNNAYHTLNAVTSQSVQRVSNSSLDT